MATSKLKQADWLLRYKPAVTCPSEAPLTRYGRSGDGGKFLCALEGERWLARKGARAATWPSMCHQGSGMACFLLPDVRPPPGSRSIACQLGLGGAGERGSSSPGGSSSAPTTTKGVGLLC